MITSLLDTDWYKLKMSAFFKTIAPTINAEFKVVNRGTDGLFDFVGKAEIIASLENIIDVINNRQMSVVDEEWLKGKFDGTANINHIITPTQTNIKYELDADGDNIDIFVSGDWPFVTLVETPLLASICEWYSGSYEMLVNNKTLTEIWRNGERILLDKIDMLNKYPGIKIVEFGTRRRFSKEWQRNVIDMLCHEYNGLAGTTNARFAREFNIQQVGTIAHECFMGFAGLYEETYSEFSQFSMTPATFDLLYAWGNMFRGDVFLTDTFTTGWFLFTMLECLSNKEFPYYNSSKLLGIIHDSNGFRHDSGCPYKFGEKIINFYNRIGIDPKTKTIVFSDNLKLPHDVINIYEHFKCRINMVFGVGTNLTNDLGCQVVPSVVMKLNKINGVGVAKISDNPDKISGADGFTIKKYKKLFKIEGE